MGGLRISDHALLRFFERAYGLQIDAMRAEIADRLARAARSAGTFNATEYTVRLDGCCYLVRDGVVVTVLTADMRAPAPKPEGIFVEPRKWSPDTPIPAPRPEGAR